MRLLDEIAEPRSVENVQLDLVPVAVSECGGQADLAGYLVRVEIRNRIAIFDSPEPIYCARIVKDSRGERGFTRTAVADDRHIPDTRSLVDLHRPSVGHDNSGRLR